jgi:imidazolonepropionase-like amidohydrolase
MHKGVARAGAWRATCISLLMAASVVACGPSRPGPTGEASASPSPRPAPTLAIVNGTLIDGTGAAAVPNAVVLIAGDRIIAAGPAATLAVPAGTRTVDAGGGTIMPGFINAHVHFAFDEANLKAWAQGGVTTVRDESATPEQIAGLKAFRSQIEKNPSDARLISSGSMLGVPGGYGQRFVNSVDEARAAVLDEVDKGVDGVKISMESGYANTHGLPVMPDDEQKVIVDTAHAHGLYVSGHITIGHYLGPMLDAGVDDVAHMPTDPAPLASLQNMVDRGVYITPTFTVFRNYGAALGTAEANLAQFVKLGGKVALGNDYGGGPGTFELGIPMFEIEEMSAAGMTPMQIIVAGTSNAAHVIRMTDSLGTLEAGKLADVLVVNGDPLSSLKALTDVRYVVHGGTVIRGG